MVTAQPSAFGALLKRYRIAAGLTQEELAERARLSTRAISDLERGARRSPYRDTVQHLAEALELSDDERAALAAAARHVAESVDRSPEPEAAPPFAANLPSEPTSFIGRQREIAAVSSLLIEPGVRMVTLTGPGGIGKTRLAVHVAASLFASDAAQVAAAYPDGVWFVSLASIGDPSLVPSAIARALSVQERGGQELVHALIEHLRARQLLLVLDNFEHLLDARSFLGELLEACPALHLLVTSRTVLNLSWERVFEVPPLALPDLSPDTDGGSVAGSEAVALFVERARAVKADFALTSENGQAVVEICRSLDGMPLAIELAAARLRLFPPQALLGRLSQRLQFLTGGAHDLPARHQTLRGAIDWSYSLLSEEEKRLFARLSVFRGGCTLEAADAVCKVAGDLEEEILEVVASLVEKSLLRQEGEQEPRFVTLETIREYAAERLEEMGDSRRLKDQHAWYCLALAEEAASGLEGPEQRAWLDRLEIERDNVRAALQWVSDCGEVDRGLRLAVALRGFWMVRGPLSEGRRYLEDLAAVPGGSTALRAAALSAAGSLAGAEGRLRDSAELVERSMALYQQLGDQRGFSDGVGGLAQAWYQSGEVERADELLRRSEVEARETGNRRLLAMSLRFQAALADERRDPRRGRLLGEESLALYRELGDGEGIADVLRTLAGAAYGAGDRQTARALVDEMLAHLRRAPLDSAVEEWMQPLSYRARMLGDYEYATRILEDLVVRAEAVGDRRITAHARTGLALLAREQGDYRRAASLYQESATILQEVGDLLGRCRALVGLSDVARDQGDAERVVGLCEESLSLLQESSDAFLTAFTLHNLGAAAWQEGDHSRAQRLFDQSFSLLQRQQSAVDAAEVLTSIGLLVLDQGEYDRAGRILTECLITARNAESRWIVGDILEGMAGVAAGTGQAERAATLLGAAEAVRLALGVPRCPSLLYLYERCVAVIMTALGQERYLQCVEQGRAMTLEQAVFFALEEVTGP